MAEKIIAKFNSRARANSHLKKLGYIEVRSWVFQKGTETVMVVPGPGKGWVIIPN